MQKATKLAVFIIGMVIILLALMSCNDGKSGDRHPGPKLLAKLKVVQSDWTAPYSTGDVIVKEISTLYKPGDKVAFKAGYSGEVIEFEDWFMYSLDVAGDSAYLYNTYDSLLDVTSVEKLPQLLKELNE